MDQSLGRIAECLKRFGLYDNTHFLYYSVNGRVTDHVPCLPLNGG